MITRKEVENLAKLSKLKFTDAELESFTRDMADIIEFANTINQNMDGAENLSEHTRAVEMDDLREDVVRPSYPNGDILSNADATNGYFVVRRNCTK